MENRKYRHVDQIEFRQIPTRHLHDTIVERGLETRGGLSGDRILQVGQQFSQRQFGGNVSEWIAGRLTRQRRTSRQTRIHFDNITLKH